MCRHWVKSGALLPPHSALQERVQGDPVQIVGGLADRTPDVLRVFDPCAEALVGIVECLLQLRDGQMLKPRERLQKVRHGNMGLTSELFRKGVVRHMPELSRLFDALATDPLVADVLAAIDQPLFLVGGAVRDPLLGYRAGPDLDLVTLTDPAALAHRLADVLGGAAVIHPRFLSAEVDLPERGRRIDLVAARRESYRALGALPEVSLASIEEDLARRDFTVNAIALRLGETGTEAILDPHDGLLDIDARLLRLIRPNAFAEDPSRLVRGVRYASRLGLRFETETEVAARAMAPALDLSSARVADELQRMFDSDTSPGGLSLLSGLGVPWVRGTAEDTCARIDHGLARRSAPDVRAWALRLGAGIQGTALKGSAFAGWAISDALAYQKGEAVAAELITLERPSEIDARLGHFTPAEAVGALTAGAESVATWWRDWQPVRLAIDGGDLLAAGAVPGPNIGRALRRVRADRLDGLVPDSRESQLELAMAEIRR